MEQQTYTIREMSERFGLPASTLRYYEEIGLLTDVIHTESKKRIYTQQHIDCMTAILCFKRTGLPIAGIQEFFRLENDIPGNIDQMVAILKEHEQNTREKIERMESDLEHIQQKYSITARFAMRLKMGMKCRRGIPAAVRRRRSRYLSRLFRRRHTQVSKEQVRKGTNIHFSYLLFLFFLSPFPFIPGIFSAFPA
jgi:DNA-binding transcriptional MerR regulator